MSPRVIFNDKYSIIHFMAGFISGITVMGFIELSYIILLVFIIYQLIDMTRIKQYSIRIIDPLDKELIEFIFGYLSGIIVWSLFAMYGINIATILRDMLHIL